MVRNSQKKKCAPVRVILCGLKPIDANFLLGKTQPCFPAPANLGRAWAESDSLCPQAERSESLMKICLINLILA